MTGFPENERGYAEMKNKLWGLLCLVLILLLSGCAPDKPVETEQKKVIKIGTAVSLTGQLAREGKLQHEGYEFWMDHVNERGGIQVGSDQYTVELVHYDDKSDAQTSAKLVERLITEDKVDIIFGPYSSGITHATAAIGEKYKVITIAANANANSIYEQGFKYVFSVNPPATASLTSLVDMANTFSPKPSTIALVYPDTLFPIYAAEGIKERAAELGFEIVYDQKFPHGAADLSTILTEVKTIDPDVVLTGADLQDTITLVRQMKEARLSPKMVGTMIAHMPDFRSSLGPDAEYVYVGIWWSPAMTWKDPVFGSADEYAKQFAAAYGRQPDQINAAASTAGVVLEEALKAAGSLETEKLRDALVQLSLETINGPTHFDETGQNVLGGSTTVQIQDGELVIVFPETIAQGEAIFPFPKWDER